MNIFERRFFFPNYSSHHQVGQGAPLPDGQPLARVTTSDKRTRRSVAAAYSPCKQLAIKTTKPHGRSSSCDRPLSISLFRPLQSHKP